MKALRKHPAIPRVALSCILLILAGSFPARCLAQQPEAAPPPGQSAPEGGGGQPRTFRGNGVIGQIQSIAPGEIKVATQDGSTATVHVTSNTAFRLDQQPAKLGDFKAGMVVFVRGTKSSDGSWDAESVASRSGPPGAGAGPGGAFRSDFIAGTVKAIDGTKITVQGMDNTVAAVEVDENTSLRKRRESITLADIHPGDSVVIRGDKKDGSFVPKTVTVVDPEQLQRMRQFMQGGGAPGGANPPAGTKPPAGASPQTPPPDTKPPQDLR